MTRPIPQTVPQTAQAHRATPPSPRPARGGLQPQRSHRRPANPSRGTSRGASCTQPLNTPDPMPVLRPRTRPSAPLSGQTPRQSPDRRSGPQNGLSIDLSRSPQSASRSQPCRQPVKHASGPQAFLRSNPTRTRPAAPPAGQTPCCAPEYPPSPQSGPNQTFGQPCGLRSCPVADPPSRQPAPLTKPVRTAPFMKSAATPPALAAPPPPSSSAASQRSRNVTHPHHPQKRAQCS